MADVGVQLVACVDGASGGRWWCKWWHVLMVQVVAGGAGASGGRC